MNLDELALELKNSGKYKVLKKLDQVLKFNDNTDKKTLSYAAYLDTETTGNNPETDEIFNIGLIQFSYDKDGNIYEIVNQYSGFQETKTPISKDSTLITGYVDADIAGKSFDKHSINNILESSNFIIAHQASYDRAFFDDLFPISKEKIWCDDKFQIPWKQNGMFATRMSDLATHYEFYFDEHEAINDAYAGVYLLTQSLNKIPNLKYLLDTLNKRYFRVFATNSAYETKSYLKSQHYKWDPKQRVWYITISQDELFVIDDLIKNVYNGDPDKFLVKEIDRVDLYKDWT